jgi:hypothetical protein
VIYLRKSLQHGHEPLMLLPSSLEMDDVVVEVVLARIRGDRQELRSRTMDEHGTQTADFRRNVDWHALIR